MDEETMDEETIERVMMLHGHVDQDSALVVEDYPYGFRLRCNIRYWVDTAAKGPGRGRQRFVSQTTDARRGNTLWNKPKAGTYHAQVFMYRRGNGHVSYFPVSGSGITGLDDTRLRLTGIFEQLDDDQRRTYLALLDWSQRLAARSDWARFREVLGKLVGHLAGSDGRMPELTNGVWTTADGERIYLGQPRDLAVYEAAAREDLALR
jgi:hypothetical protein